MYMKLINYSIPHQQNANQNNGGPNIKQQHRESADYSSVPTTIHELDDENFSDINEKDEK